MDTTPQKNNYVIVNGCFDVLHAGHIRLLNYAEGWARKRGSKFFVCIDSDEKVKRDKGSLRPYFNQYERSLLVHSLYACEIDEVMPFDTDEELERIIKDLNPQYLIKGESWEGNVVGSQYVGEVVFLPIDLDISTSEIEKRIRSKYLKELKLQHPGADL